MKKIIMPVIIVIVMAFLALQALCIACPLIDIVCDEGYQEGPRVEYQQYSFCVFTCDMPSCEPDPSYTPTDPALIISSQSVVDNQVNIATFYSDRPAFVVLKQNIGSDPVIVGKSQVWEGLIRDMKVTVDPSKVTPYLVAHMYYDDGDFEFDPELDDPVIVDDQEIMTTFRIQ